MANINSENTPSKNTVGQLGDIITVTTTGKRYKLVAIYTNKTYSGESIVYEWDEIIENGGSGGSGGSGATPQQAAQIEQNKNDISQLSGEITVERERINQFTKLKEGSTTGDAELIDGRTDYMGHTWDNIGEHIRGVSSQLSGEIDDGGTIYSVSNKSANGAGLYENTTRLATEYITVKKGDLLRINTGTLQNGVTAWKSSVNASNMWIAQNWRNENQDFIIEHDGIAVVVFRKADDSAITSTEYDGNVFHVKTFYKNVIADMKKLKEYVDYSDEELTVSFNNTLALKEESINLIFEIGGLNTDNGYELNSVNRARSKMFFLSRPMRVASTDDEYSFRVLKYSEDGKTYIGALNTSNQSEYQIDGGFSYRLLIFPTTASDLSNHIPTITSNIVVMVKKSVYVVAKDGTGDFEDIQHCLDFISKTEKTTILIKSGTYDKICTLTQKKYVDDTSANSNNKWYNRKLNLIGVSQTDCIIKSTTGEYYTPAAEICITGEVRNLTFISDHTEPPENRSEDAKYLNHKAYAVHSDSGTEDVLYNNCRMVSYQAPAMGIGGAQDKKIRIRNCHLESYAPSTGEYSPLVNFGGLFYHLYAGDGKTGQLLEVEDSYIYSENGSVSAWITPSTATNYEQETHLRRNCFYGKMCGKNVDVSSDMLAEDCFGNNISTLNK